MRDYRIYSFEKLEVYQDALDLCVKIYGIVANFPKEEQYDLARQIKRAMSGVTANLAEGSGRASGKDQAHFTNMAYASVLEVINHFNLALKLQYLSSEVNTQLRLSLEKIINQLNALYKYQINNEQTLKKRVKKD